MLEEYRSKRDFSRTREPAPADGRSGGGSLRFVVQKHAARRLHYDFRLELDGVLKSWAVPKGPSADPKEKRLAVHVEDHPLEYATFEGVIAHGNYGGGQVIVWDTGAYSPDEGGLSFGHKEESEERMRADLERGKLSFTLRGRKLKGSWTLVRTSRNPKDWLLIKHRDEHVDTEHDLVDQDRSVQSGLTLEDLKEGRLPEPASGGAALSALGTPGDFPARMKPMLARTADRPFSHPDWLFEPKLDGHRVLAFIQDGNVTLLSRNGNDLTSAVPMIVQELEAQPEGELVLDGELVALDSEGHPNFGLLQQTMQLEPRAVDRPAEDASLAYYPFDVLHVDGRDLRRVPLFKRKEVLGRALIGGDHVRQVEYIDGEGETFYRAASELGLEGMVAKKRDSIYEPGRRSASWLKVKGVREQELVIGGYTPGTGSRASTFGSLMVGYHDNGVLKYAGRVGSGFDARSLKSLRASLDSISADASPFAPDPEVDAAGAAWVRPVLVARVKFAEWTHADRLRAPVFLGLRTDVDAGSVTRSVEETVTLDGGPAPAPGWRGGAPATAQWDHPPQAVDDVPALLEQLSGKQDKLLLTVSGHRIGLTNLNKALWPETGAGGPYTKRDLVRHYLETSDHLLPHLKDRPLTFTRYPNGIHEGSFYQKHSDLKRPEFVETVRLYSSHNEGDGDFIMANNLPTLVWLAQLASIELHPWLSRVTPFPDAAHLPTTFTGSKEAIDASVLNYPDFIVFDLDPYIYSGKEKSGDEPELNRRAFSKTVEVARELKDILDQLSLSSFIKTSGKTGLHIYVPVLRQYGYPVTRSTCQLIGRFLMQHLPQDVTMEWTVSKRAGKIFLDHNQNVRTKNMASIYSLRPAPNAPVSTPLRWEELDRVYPTDFTIETTPERLREAGDLWAGILAAKHDLRRLLEEAV